MTTQYTSCRPVARSYYDFNRQHDDVLPCGNLTVA